MMVSTAGGVALCCRKCGSQTPDRWLNESRNTHIDGGSTVNGCGMGHGGGGPHEHWYSGHAKLEVNGRMVSGESSYRVYAEGTAYSRGESDWVAIGFDPSDYIRFGKPTVSGNCSMSYGTPRVYASAIGGRGSASWTMYLFIDDWYGPGDNDVNANRVISGSGTVSAVDRVVSYDYEYSISGRSGSGYGSSFSDTPSMVDAGGYCYVTFYTESGLSNSKEIPIPDIATLTYNANGGTGTPSSQTVWEGQSVTVSTLKPTRNNYEFLGWNRSSAYNDLPYGAGVPSGTLTGGSSITLNSDTTLYAVWRTVKVPYNIAFTLNGNPATNDFVNITGTVVDKNGTRRDITNSRAFSALEIPGYTVSAYERIILLRKKCV